MIFESIKMVFKVFRTNKLRTFLTMLGIIIGIFAITIIFAISSATQESITGELSDINFSEINVQIMGTMNEDGQFVMNFPKSELLKLKDEECIKTVSEIKNYSFKEMDKILEEESSDTGMFNEGSQLIRNRI